MKRLMPLLLVALAGCAAASASSQDMAGREGPSPQEIVAARQAAFHLSAATFSAMRPTVEKGGDVKPLAFGARGLNHWASALPALFPADTQLPESHARAELWSNRADFVAKAGVYQQATAALVQAAQAGDAGAFKTAYGAVGASCKACHDLYRAEAAH